MTRLRSSSAGAAGLHLIPVIPAPADEGRTHGGCMPGDLFATVAVRPPSVQSQRSPILVVSLGVHVVVLLAVLIGSAIAPGVLPTPREVLAFYEPIRMDIKLPPPPPAPRPPTTVP